MARSARVQFPGAVYHIWARGNHQENIYFSDQDRKLFIRLLAATAKRMNWICHAYCLMTNHYHLLLETPDGLLSNGMSYVNGVYTQKINRRYGLTGHLFQERFHSKLIDGNPQFLATVRYIIRNALEANMVEDAGDWPWSSYRATTGQEKPPDFLMVDQVLSLLSNDRRTAQKIFREFIHTKDNEEALLNMSHQIVESIKISTINRAAPSIDIHRSLRPVPRKQKIIGRPSLETMFEGIGCYDHEKRNHAIMRAYQQYAYTQSEIGNFLGLHRASISRIANKLTK